MIRVWIFVPIYRSKYSQTFDIIDFSIGVHCGEMHGIVV